MPERSVEPPVEPPAQPAPAGAAKPVKPPAAFLRALGKVTRAFTLYDAANALVRQFLDEYRLAAEAATRDGPLVLDVAPFELKAAGEVVYHEEDREKSLAFRLYRDGVRRITFAAGIPFGELLRLLEILAVRLGGVRQAEEDVVTLLRKQDFTAIEVVAVEAYTAEETRDDRAGGHGRIEIPPIDPAFDTPLPRLPPPRPIERREVPDAALARLRREEDPSSVVPSALALAQELLSLGTTGELPAEDVTRFCKELRDWLVASRQLGPLAALADAVRARAGVRIRDEILRGLGDARLLDLVVSAIPAGSTELPAHAARLLPFVPSAAVVARLVEAKEGSAAALVALVTARLPGDVDALLEKLAAIPAVVARALVKAIGARAPARRSDAALALVDHPDAALRGEALRAAAALGAKVPPARATALLSDPSPEIRIAAAAALERSGDAASARTLLELLEGRRELSRDEAAAFARAFGKLKPAVAYQLFEGWVRPRRGLLRAFRAGGREELLRWAAIAGLGAIGRTEAEHLIEVAALEGDEALRRHCQQTLARSRGESRRG